MSESDTVPVITLSPTPPQQGGKLEICYSGTPGTVLTLDWFPSGTPGTVTIPASGCITVQVPRSAQSITVVDPTGGAANATTAIIPRY